MLIGSRTLRGLLFGLLAAAGLNADEVRRDQASVDGVEPQDRRHWAYLPTRRPSVPSVNRSDWVRTPVDNFILARLEARGWEPSPSARPHDSLRRLYLDLIGLPPTIAEQDRFMADPSPARFDQEAERLLRRPGYGERWGRHWLDLVRYAESNGYERDAEKPHVWRYRDYVIQAFNNDKPYDRFVLEQLAGDELDDRSSESVIATGFYRLGPWDDEPADFAQDRHDQLDDMIRTTTQVFLGLSMGCARCHDHKFDALSMRDYYRLSAILAPMSRPQSGRQDLDAPSGTREQLAVLAERDRRIEELRQRRQAIRDRFRRDFLAAGTSGLDELVIAAFVTPDEERDKGQKKLVAENQDALNREIDAHLPADQSRRVDELDRQITDLPKQVPDLPRGYFLVEEGKEPPQSFLLHRGRAASRGPEVQPGLPAVLVRQQPRFEKRAGTSGRRLTMARWIAHPDNPLTARVIVNRVWQYHFGEGLVRTPSDFGVMGDSPTHPELLDWLAHWFVHDARWSLKELHRMVVRSNAYRLSKNSNPEYARDDPENRLLWRFPYRRLQVEVMRDSMLAASGELNREMYGPAVKLNIPAVVVEGHADRHTIWKPSGAREQSRRTVYAFVKRSLVVPMLEVLDLCDTTRSTEKRNVTSVAPQALTLFNGDFVNQQARRLAERVILEVDDDPARQVDLAWRLALCRSPDDSELRAIVNFLVTETRAAVESAGAGISPDEAHCRALTQVCRVLFNLNEFAYPN